MQGKKKFTSKLFVNFRLDKAVLDANFYKVLKKNLVKIIYKSTKFIYSYTRKLGIDNIAFKFMWHWK